MKHFPRTVVSESWHPGFSFTIFWMPAFAGMTTNKTRKALGPAPEAARDDSRRLTLTTILNSQQPGPCHKAEPRAAVGGAEFIGNFWGNGGVIGLYTINKYYLFINILYVIYLYVIPRSFWRGTQCLSQFHKVVVTKLSLQSCCNKIVMPAKAGIQVFLLQFSGCQLSLA